MSVHCFHQPALLLASCLAPSSYKSLSVFRVVISSLDLLIAVADRIKDGASAAELAHWRKVMLTVEFNMSL